MLTIQALSILASLASLTLVSAHGHVAAWTVNGEKKAGFNPIPVDKVYPTNVGRPPTGLQYGPTAERPTDNTDEEFDDENSGTVACGSASPGQNVQTWDLDAGSTVTAHWRSWPYGHDGPVLEYMARCPGTSCNGVAADSLDWFKIGEASYSNGKWATWTVSEERAWSFKIPADLAPGPYLVRHELIAMQTTTHPQVYPVCFQANLKSNGTAVPKDTTTFPDAYNINPDFRTYDINVGGDMADFKPPGPPVYVAGSVKAPAPEPPANEVVASASSTSALRSSTAAPTSSAGSVSSAAASQKSDAPSPTSAESVPAGSSASVAVGSSAAPIPASSAIAVPVITPPTTSASSGGSAPKKTCMARRRSRRAARAL